MEYCINYTLKGPLKCYSLSVCKGDGTKLNTSVTDTWLVFIKAHRAFIQMINSSFINT